MKKDGDAAVNAQDAAEVELSVLGANVAGTRKERVRFGASRANPKVDDREEPSLLFEISKELSIVPGRRPTESDRLSRRSTILAADPTTTTLLLILPGW